MKPEDWKCNGCGATLGVIESFTDCQFCGKEFCDECIEAHEDQCG